MVKKNGSRVEFDRRKLRASLQLALRKRPVAAEQVDATKNAVASIADAFTHERIVRVMPNTPAAIGEGMSAWTATASSTTVSNWCLPASVTRSMCKG